MNEAIAARIRLAHPTQAALLGLLLFAGLLLADSANADHYRDTGSHFSDRCRDIAEIRVRSGWWIDAVQVVCDDGERGRRGGHGGGEHRFRLRPGEYIVGITGRRGGPAGDYVYALQFHTNLRSSPVYGAAGPDHGWKPFHQFARPGERITGFGGLSGRYLRHITVATAPMYRGWRPGNPAYRPGFHAGRPIRRDRHHDRRYTAHTRVHH